MDINVDPGATIGYEMKIGGQPLILVEKIIM